MFDSVTVLETTRQLDIETGPHGKQMFVDEALPVSAINISQRCLARCNYCGIDAKPTDPQMPWDVFKAILQSYRIVFVRSKRILLGDGEVILYQDDEGHKLFEDVLEELAENLRLDVSFVTAGLIKPNLGIGLRNLQDLAQKWYLKEKVHSGLSFNLLNHHATPEREYVNKMVETFNLLENFSSVTVSMMSDPNDNSLHTLSVLQKSEIWKALLSDRGFYEGRTVQINVGRAAANYVTPLRVITDREKTCRILDSNSPAFYSIMPNGDVGIDCPGYGKRGTILGNIFENDARQIHENYRRFLTEFRERVGSEDRQIAVCEAHRTWNKRYVSPRSDHPVVRKALSCSRS